MIKLNEHSRSGLNFGDTLTSATGHGISIDQTSDAAMVAHLNNSPGGGNSSFDFDHLQESSILTTDKRQADINQQNGTNYNSGGLKVSLLNAKSPTLPNILPAMQSDAKLVRNSRMVEQKQSPTSFIQR